MDQNYGVIDLIIDIHSYMYGEIYFIMRKGDSWEWSTIVNN